MSFLKLYYKRVLWRIIAQAKATQYFTLAELAQPEKARPSVYYSFHPPLCTSHQWHNWSVLCLPAIFYDVPLPQTPLVTTIFDLHSGSIFKHWFWDYENANSFYIFSKFVWNDALILEKISLQIAKKGRNTYNIIWCFG